MLVYSPADIHEVNVSVDGVFLGSAELSGGALYTLPWQPERYAAGVHHMTVSAEV